MNSRFDEIRAALGPLATAKRWYLTGSIASQANKRKAPHTLTDGGLCLVKGWPQCQGAVNLDAIVMQLKTITKRLDGVRIGFVAGLEHEERVLIVLDFDDHHPTLPPLMFTHGKLSKLGIWLVEKFVNLASDMVLASQGGRGIHIPIWVDKAALSKLPASLFYEDSLTGRTVKVEILGSQFVNLSAKFLNLGQIKQINEEELLMAIEYFQASRKEIAHAKQSVTTTRRHATVLDPVTRIRVESALKALSSDDRQTWIDFGLALAPCGEEGFALWHEWSRKSPKYKGEDDCRKTWESLNSRGEISIASILYRAQESGWCPPSPSTPLAQADTSTVAFSSNKEPWEDPLPLEGLEQTKAEPFVESDLPDSLRPFMVDIASRLCVPLESVAAATLTTVSGLVGSQAVIRPKAHDSWVEPLNQWSLIVAPPGSRKSPMFQEILKPVYALEAEARRKNQALLELYDMESQRGTKEPLDQREQRLRRYLPEAKRLLTKHSGEQSVFKKDVRARFALNEIDAQRLFQLAEEALADKGDTHQSPLSTQSTVDGVKIPLSWEI